MSSIYKDFAIMFGCIVAALSLFGAAMVLTAPPKVTDAAGEEIRHGKYDLICLDGVAYWSAIKSMSVAYNPNGTIRTCGE